jgi:uncharacterized protein involved in exopolysaccharide biosynthesis
MTENAKKYAQLFWKRKNIFLRAVVGGLAIAAAVIAKTKSEFSSTIRILPYKNTGSATGGLSGLAGLAGIRLPTGSADVSITTELYPEVANSTDYRKKLASVPIYFGRTDEYIALIEYFKNNRRKASRYDDQSAKIGNQGIAPDQIRTPSNGSRSPNDSSQNTSTPKREDKELVGIVNAMKHRLAVSVDKKTGVITISTLMPDPFAAADLAQKATDLLMREIIAFESQKSTEQFNFILEQQTQASARYRASQEALVAFMDRNRAIEGGYSIVRRDQLQKDVALAYEVYQQLSRDLESSRIKMNQDTPLFMTLEKAQVPWKRAKPRVTNIIIISTICSLLLGASVVLIAGGDTYRNKGSSSN